MLSPIPAFRHRGFGLSSKEGGDQGRTGSILATN